MHSHRSESGVGGSASPVTCHMSLMPGHDWGELVGLYESADVTEGSTLAMTVWRAAKFFMVVALSSLPILTRPSKKKKNLLVLYIERLLYSIYRHTIVVG